MKRNSHGQKVAIECPYCGTIYQSYLYSIIIGDAKSCGCLVINNCKKLHQGNTTHGLSNTRAYTSWQAMWARCTKPKNDNYQYYGGRGITIHPEWGKFENFLQDMGER